jgi:dipeptidyl aminopeptidase/acylaminoacyl peptidase
VDSIRAPLIVVYGAWDPRVPIGETEQIVDAIRAREEVVEYVRFEDEGHGIVKRHNRIRAYSAIADFFDRYIKV